MQGLWLVLVVLHDMTAQIYHEMERRYNVAARSILSARRKSSILNMKRRDTDHDDFVNAAKFETELFLAKMKSMTPQEVAAAAAEAVAEAELAMAKAEEAVREAEAAEADAKAAHAAFVEEALKTLKKGHIRKMMPCLTKSGTSVSQLEPGSD